MRYKFLLIFCLSFIQCNAFATLADLQRLQSAFPEFIKKVTDDYIVWADESKMATQDGNPHKTQQEKLDAPALIDQMDSIIYQPGIPDNTTNYVPENDPGRIRYEPFLRKMYGNSKEEVETHLVTIYWMPKIFGFAYPLQVTTINHVDQKLIAISNELEILATKHPEYLRYLEEPGGTFDWRVIANTNRLSAHSFGMTLDINFKTTNYWQWDLANAGLPINEDTPLTYRNDLPWEIVPIFEKYGFISGGKWYHYDSMHFEYRPELFPVDKINKLQ